MPSANWAPPEAQARPATKTEASDSPVRTGEGSSILIPEIAIVKVCPK
jgi:hypothetical protein